MNKLLVIALLLTVPLPVSAQRAEEVQLSVHVRGPEFNGILNTNERRKALEDEIADGTLKQLKSVAHRPLIVGKERKKPAIVMSVFETKIQIEFRKADRDPEIE